MCHKCHVSHVTWHIMSRCGTGVWSRDFDLESICGPEFNFLTMRFWVINFYRHARQKSPIATSNQNLKDRHLPRPLNYRPYMTSSHQKHSVRGVRGLLLVANFFNKKISHCANFFKVGCVFRNIFFQRTTVLFNNYVDIYEVDDYDRKIEKTWTRLSQLEKVIIWMTFIWPSFDPYSRLTSLTEKFQPRSSNPKT